MSLTKLNEWKQKVICTQRLRMLVDSKKIKDKIGALKILAVYYLKLKRRYIKEVCPYK